MFFPLSNPLVPVAMYTLYDDGVAVSSLGSFCGDQDSFTLFLDVNSMRKSCGANG